jgi:hypothetical protein
VVEEMFQFDGCQTVEPATLVAVSSQKIHAAGGQGSCAMVVAVAAHKATPTMHLSWQLWSLALVKQSEVFGIFNCSKHSEHRTAYRALR